MAAASLPKDKRVAGNLPTRINDVSHLEIIYAERARLRDLDAWNEELGCCWLARLTWGLLDESILWKSCRIRFPSWQ